MPSITIVGTRHENLGICCSSQLLDIIVDLNPDVIFEEMPESTVAAFYRTKQRRNLESDAISQYAQQFDTLQVPVDSDDIPPDEFFRSHERLHKRVKGLIDSDGFTYRSQLDNHRRYVYQYGFIYLNSPTNDAIQQTIQGAVESALDTLNDKELSSIHATWKEIIDTRERHMIRKILDLCASKDFSRGVFIIGSAHRQSLANKLSDLVGDQSSDVDWNFYHIAPKGFGHSDTDPQLQKKLR